MSLSNTAETAVLDQVFRGVALVWNSNTDLWLAAYSADPGETGTAVTSEISYGSYSRTAVNRLTGLSVSGNQCTNAALVQLPQSTSPGSDITHVALVDTSAGAGTIVARATLQDSIPTTVGVRPQFAANALIFTVD